VGNLERGPNGHSGDKVREAVSKSFMACATACPG